VKLKILRITIEVSLLSILIMVKNHRLQDYMKKKRKEGKKEKEGKVKKIES
jgi:hypothetical protein